MKIKCSFCGELNEVQTKPRSLNENSYLHGVVLPLLSDHTGYTADELKTALKKKFGWLETKEVMGMMIEIPISTAQMTTTDFEKFMSQIRMFASAELNVYVPEPNEL